ncbi:MAG: AAA family ATPase [Actinobacteria bacterium]|nr:AAA family ATPase [Actinomycetota bacterium]
MLAELSVRDLGVIEELRLVIGPGMTALTGETGAGKTLVVQAIQLLTGGRADSSLVRAGATEAVVEGRFVVGDEEIIVSRIIPADGRSRAYIDGRMANAAALGDAGRRLIDLHGQHTHQSLLSTSVQRRALDQHGKVDLTPLLEARHTLDEVVRRLDGLGGDARARAHELDLLRYQVAEIATAAVASETEDADLESQQGILSNAQALIEAATNARLALTADGGALDAVGSALAALTGLSGNHAAFQPLIERLRSAQADLEDIGAAVRDVGDSIDNDPAQLETLRQRHQMLRELIRKYGDTLGDVITFGSEAGQRVDQLERHDELAAELERHGQT